MDFIWRNNTTDSIHDPSHTVVSLAVVRTKIVASCVLFCLSSKSLKKHRSHQAVCPSHMLYPSPPISTKLLNSIPSARYEMTPRFKQDGQTAMIYLCKQANEPFDLAFAATPACHVMPTRSSNGEAPYETSHGQPDRIAQLLSVTYSAATTTAQKWQSRRTSPLVRC